MKQLLIIALLLAAPLCQAELDLAAKEFKQETLQACGNEEPCKAAVEAQFESCHNKYINDWNGYLESSMEDEKKMLEAYSKNIYGCIVDANGKPYFKFKD